MNSFALVTMFGCLALIFKVEMVDGIRCYECLGPVCHSDSFNEETAQQCDGIACYLVQDLKAKPNSTKPLKAVRGCLSTDDGFVSDNCVTTDFSALCQCSSDLCNMATHGITSVFILAALVIIAAICKYE